MLKSSVFKGHHIDLSIVSKERKKRRCMKLCKNESHPLTKVKRLIESVINNNKTVKFCLLFSSSKLILLYIHVQHISLVCERRIEPMHLFLTWLTWEDSVGLRNKGAEQSCRVTRIQSLHQPPPTQGIA